MRLTFFKTNKPSEAMEDIELDITPLMNIFIILVAFLISMAIFTHLSIVEFTLPPNVNSSMNSSDQKPVPKLTVRIDERMISLVLGDQVLDSITVMDGKYLFDSLSEKLASYNKSTYNKEIIVASTDAIPFKLVVRTMDICRDAGFEKVGLSSATVDPGSGI